MRRGLCAVLCAAALLTLCCAAAAQAQEVLYFYENLCESCTPEEDFLAEYESLTGQTLSTASLKATNVFHAGGQQALADAAAAHGLDPDDVSLPLTIIDGAVYQGSSDLYTRLPQDVLAAAETDESILYYLYVPACESCASVEAILSDIPASVSVKRGLYTFDSAVTVQKIDASVDPALASSLFDAYQVPDAQRITPSVFYAQGYLSGADAIETSLLAQVKLGRAVGGISLSGSDEDEGAASWSFAGTALAGLVGGLNPCALSMLLLFLSTLLRAGKKAGAYATAFLTSKLVCYLLIGTALLGLFQQLNPAWLLPASRIILTVLGGAMAALNLWDAWQARRGEYGQIRNQLPAGMRRGLHGFIERLEQAPARRFLPAVCALGALVAGGEFLCAGQLYLMSLLGALQSGAAFWRMAMMLLVYCAAFLLPSILLCVIVVRAGALMAASGFLAKHMAKVKLITAIAMILIIVAAWIV